jgi:hypothetical protein
MNKYLLKLSNRLNLVDLEWIESVEVRVWNKFKKLILEIDIIQILFRI